MTPRQFTIILQLGTLLACALLLVGCGGGGSDDDDGGSDAPKVSEQDLDLGAYEAEAGDVPETAGDLANGRAVEARRLAELVVDPATLDDRFQAVGLPTGALASPNEITRAFSSEDPKLFKDRVSGAASRRFMGSAVEDRMSMSMSLVSFEDAATAARFVKSIGDKNERNSINPIVGTMTYSSRTTLPGHPKVRASLFGLEPNDPKPSLAALAAYGDVVAYGFISQRGEGANELPLAKQLMSKAFTAQAEALEGFESTPLVETLSLPVDEDGLTKLVLAGAEANPEDQEPDVPQVWGPNGALLQQTWAGTLPEAFERAEVDALVQWGANVYRTGSAKQATRLLKDFKETVTENQYREHNTPKGLRDAQCFELVDPDSTSILAPNFCQVQYDRYVAETPGVSAEDAEARISAQYLLLQNEVD